MNIEPKTLYIVGTPIGNLEDMTFRAVEVLRKVDKIAAEDTRHTGKLLAHFQIKTPQISYHEHNTSSRIPQIISEIRNGQSIALVSDAGIPGISDPGYELVKNCVESNIKVVPIPGATAAITALSASGLPTDKFVFEGFLTTKKQQRKEYLELIKTETRTVIFYESPHRLRETLQDLAQTLGEDRDCVVSRELTKLYEEFWRGTLGEAVSHHKIKQPQGEYTLIIAGFPQTQPQLSTEQIKTELEALIKQGMSRSQASRHLAKATSLPRRRIYQLALEVEDISNANE